MNKIRVVVIAVALACSTACHGSNQHGECIGVVLTEEDPTLRYEVDVWNTVWSFLFVKTIIAPVLWATNFAKCPVGPR